MSILDNILGGGSNSGGSDSAQQSNSSHDFSSVIGIDPSLGLSLHDLLSSNQSSEDGGGTGGSDSSDFTGLGSLGAHVSAPTLIGVSSMNDQSSASENHGNDHGGLLNGLL